MGGRGNGGMKDGGEAIANSLAVRFPYVHFLFYSARTPSPPAHLPEEEGSMSWPGPGSRLGSFWVHPGSFLGGVWLQEPPHFPRK